MGNKSNIIDSKIKILMEKYKEDLQYLDDEGIKTEIDAISTNSLFLDSALGIGGIPRGRITEIWGENSCGKTTLCQHLCINALSQYPEQKVAFIDTEHALNVLYAKKIGLDLSRTLISQPSSGEKAIEIAEALIRSGTVSLVIVDSVAGLTPEAELEGDITDQHQAQLARLLHKSWRKLKDAVRETNTALVFTNQTSIQSMGYVTYKGPKGGDALKFGASVRIQLNRDNNLITVNKEKVAQLVTATVVKNKVASPYREAKFYIVFGEGISKLFDVLEISLNAGILVASGNWIKYKDESIGNGKSQAIEFLKQNKEVCEEITKLAEEYHFKDR